MRGIIEVVRAEHEAVTVEGIWNNIQIGKSQSKTMLMRRTNFHSSNMYLSIYFQCYKLHGMHFCG